MDPLEARIYWESIAEHGLDILLTLDLHGRIRSINRVIPPIEAAQILGVSWLTFIPADKQAWLEAELARVLSTGEPFSYEIMTLAPHGSNAWYASPLAPLREGATITGALLLTRDIIESKERDAQVLASDRLASVGTLAAGVAHEINNPLAVVMSNLELAMQRLERNEQASAIKEELAEAQGAAERVRVIVQDLKLFSRSAEHHQGPVDLHATLESVLRMASNEIRFRARLVRELGAVPPVLANEARLAQVLLNLVLNAAQAIPDGNAELNELRVTTRVAPGAWVAVDITDTGTGMSEAIRKRIFMPFFTTKAIGLGTGLGLSISEGIVKSLGGEIRVRSEEGVGSTFTVLLRAASAELPPDAPTLPVPSPTPPPVAARASVLIVDDEPLVAKGLQRALQRDHDVVVETSAEAALARLRDGERFDVLFCDLMMPRITGMELYRTLCAVDEAQAKRMIFITGGAFTTSAREFLDSVPNVCMEKPFDLVRLRALVGARVSTAGVASSTG